MENYPPTPLGFQSGFLRHTKPEVLLNRAFAGGNFSLADEILAEGNVGKGLQLQYFFATGNLDACRALLSPPLPQLGNVDFTLIERPRSFITSLLPLKVLELFSFWRRTENTFLRSAEQHRDGLLENLDPGVDPQDLGFEGWVISPTMATVKVYHCSAEFDLCRAFHVGLQVTWEHVEPFSGVVRPELLAEALFCVGALEPFGQVVQRFPVECRTYIEGLNPRGRQPDRVDALQIYTRTFLLREAARAVLMEVQA